MMLNVVGKKTIHIRASTNNTEQAAVAVMIAGDGMLLLLMNIFNGRHDGCIA